MTEDSDIDWSQVKLVWHCEVPDIPNLHQLVIKDCEKCLWGLDKVSDLVFHHVFLGEDMEHDVITVWGEEDNEDLHCEYHADVRWASIDSEENENED
jgi:hypothetical protein